MCAPSEVSSNCSLQFWINCLRSGLFSFNLGLNLNGDIMKIGNYDAQKIIFTLNLCNMVIGRFPNAPDGSDAVHHTILFWIFKPQYHWTPIWLPKVTLRISRARAIILEHKNTLFKDVYTLKSRRARRLGYLDKCPNPEQLDHLRS